MKVIKKNYKFVLGILIGGILFGSIGIYAGTLMNSNEVNFTPQNNKWNVTKVDEALNSLYSVAVPEEYSGTTSVTPTYSDITLNTQDKLLKNNITISGIPSTYKNLTSTTTVTADKLSSGETAYNSDGNLITGTGSITSSTCVSGTYNKPANSQWNCSFDFAPTRFMLVLAYTGYTVVRYSYDSTQNNKIYATWTKSNGTTSGGLNTTLNLNTANLTSNATITDDLYKDSYAVKYIICK